MLTKIRKHDSYLNFVVEQLDLQFNDKTFLKDFYSKPIAWCSLVDLTDAGTLLKHLYSSIPEEGNLVILVICFAV
jgi:hypothetical protein